jgi:nitrogen PTS system EIIA component
MTLLQLKKDYIDEASVVFLKSSRQEEVIQELIGSLSGFINPDLSKEIYQKILEREQICSTGIGMGVALPHAKSEELNEFRIVIGVHKEGLEWQAIDAIRVQYIFLIIGPEDKKEEYLSLLRDLSERLHDQDLLDKLFFANTQQEVVKYLKTC